MTGEELSTAEGLLRYLLVKNAHGVWFIQRDDSYVVVLPRWLWVYAERACPNPRVIGSESK